MNIENGEYDISPNLIKEITEYNKPTLRFLYVECKLTPEQIALLYSKAKIKMGEITPLRIRKDLKTWRIVPAFLSSNSVVKLLEDTITDYDKKIKHYDNIASDVYKKIKNLVLLKSNLLAEAKKSKNEELKGILDEIFAKEMNISQLIASQQKDENIRLAYSKARQIAIDQLLRAREIEIKAINYEDIITVIYDELKSIDPVYAENFYVNVKKKIIEIIGSDSIIEGTAVGKQIYKNYIKDSGKNEDASKIPMQGRNLTYEETIRKLAEKYNVHYQVALKAYSLSKKEPRKNYTMQDYIRDAILWAHVTFNYIDENGRFVSKNKHYEKIGLTIERDRNRNQEQNIKEDIEQNTEENIQEENKQENGEEINELNDEIQ